MRLASVAHVRRRRRGWTLIEVLIAVGLVVLVTTKAALVLRTASDVSADETSALHYQDQASRVIDRVALAVMGSDRETLLPQVQDVHTSLLRYTCNLGVEDGEVVWSAPEEIALSDLSKVQWRENPDAAAERRVVWTNLVTPLLEGEVVNGIDDNGNGLIDEEGLSFLIEGDRVTIRLTLRRPEVGGRRIEQTVERVVTCRN